MYLGERRVVISGASPGRPKTSILTNIQALRAIAVIAVVLYHLWPTRLPGGYIGVDVFFVISGYLITAHLVREVAAAGKVSLPVFYARRARRLLPAALTVIVITAVGMLAWMPMTRWDATFKELIASALYFENWALVAKAT